MSRSLTMIVVCHDCSMNVYTPLSLQLLGVRAGKKGVTVLAGNAKGGVIAFSLAAVKDEQVCNQEATTSSSL